MAAEKPGYMSGGWKDKYHILKWQQRSCSACKEGEGPLPTYFVENGMERACSACEGTGIERYLVAPSAEAIYFVLRLDEDPHARRAARAYADSVEADNPQFAADIRKKVSEVETEPDVGGGR